MGNDDAAGIADPTDSATASLRQNWQAGGRISVCLSSKSIRRSFRALGVAIAVAEAFIARNAVGPDARSYLEIARAYLRHDWPMAVNSYWGPLYSWILAPFLTWAKPSLRKEFPLVHFVNVGLFVLCALAFEFFWSELLLYRASGNLERISPPPLLADNVLWALGYIDFVVLMTGLVPLINPDLTLAIFVLASTALLLRILRDDNAPKRIYVWMGIALALGYLTKAMMFPMAFIFLGVMIPAKRRNRLRLGLSLAVFIVISAPQVAWISASKGYPTFSETGKLAFAWMNYKLPDRNWQGGPAGSGIPAHATRTLYGRPNVFEFNGPIRSSYPPWYDPSYWNQGMSPRFQRAVVIRHFVSQLGASLLMFFVPHLWIIGIAILFVLASPVATMRNLLHFWPLLIIIVALVAAYCLTLAIPRYYAPWQMLFWGAILCSIQLRKGIATSKYARVFVTIALLAAFLSILQIAHGIYGALRSIRPDDATPDYITAEGLKKMGVRPGEKVASIGFDNDAYYAYLDGLSIVAEINTNDTCEFWQASESVQSEIMKRFRQAGVQVIVANTGAGVRNTDHAVPLDTTSCFRRMAGWEQIVGSPNHVFFLQ